MKDILTKFGSNFLVSAFVPSLAFVALAMVVFRPLIPQSLLTSLQNTLEPFDQSGVLLLALAVILGFTLSSLNTSIYKILEGYSLLAHIPLFRKRQQRKYAEIETHLKKVEEEIKRLEEREDAHQREYNRLIGLERDVIQAIETASVQGAEREGERLKTLLKRVHKHVHQLAAEKKENTLRLKQLEDERYYLLSEMHLRFPFSREAVLPTAFGNLLRAAEAYAGDRYGIDAVRLWPRLIHVIPQSYYEKVEQSNNGLAFLINCSILSLLFSLLCGLATGYQILALSLTQATNGAMYCVTPIGSGQCLVTITEPQVYLYSYGFLFIFMLCLFFIFYKGSFPIVIQYGDMIRSSFDLFRFRLLEEFHLEPPKTLQAEREVWRKISEFLVMGEHRGTLCFKYQTAATVERSETTKRSS
ncbi:MAG: hypothetical protein ACP5HM_13910 [Anaerolineae bacterium]